MIYNGFKKVELEGLEFFLDFEIETADAPDGELVIRKTVEIYLNNIEVSHVLKEEIKEKLMEYVN